MRRALVLIGVAGLLAIGAFFLYIGEGKTPPGQPPLANLDAGSMERLKQAFNEAASDQRLLVLFSPT